VNHPLPYCCCCCCCCTSPRCALCIFTQAGRKNRTLPCVDDMSRAIESRPPTGGWAVESGDRAQSDRGWHLPGGDTKGETRILFIEFIVFFSSPTPPPHRRMCLPKFSPDSIPGRGRVHRSSILIYRLVGFRNPARYTRTHDRQPCPRTTGIRSSSGNSNSNSSNSNSS